MDRWYRTPILRQIGHVATYFPLRAAYGFFACLPSSLMRSACCWVATLIRWVDRTHARCAAANLTHAFPEKTNKERQAIVRGMYRHFALMIRDTILLWRHRNEDLLKTFFEDSDIEPFFELKREGKGLILVTGHLGNWEMAGCAFNSVYQINGFSHEFRNPYIRKSLIRLRATFGQKTIFTTQSMEVILECLRRNECLALLPDKHMKTSRIKVTFFGRHVYAPSGPAILSWRSGAPIFIGAAFRIGLSSRFRLETCPVIRPDLTAVKGAEIRRITQAYMDALEDLIRRHPEQWIWFHNRWKKQLPVP